MSILEVVPFVRLDEVHISDSSLVICYIVSKRYFVWFGLTARYNGASAVGAHCRSRSSSSLHDGYAWLTVLIMIKLVKVCLLKKLLAVLHYLRFWNSSLFIQVKIRISESSPIVLNNLAWDQVFLLIAVKRRVWVVSFVVFNISDATITKQTGWLLNASNISSLAWPATATVPLFICARFKNDTIATVV